MSVKYLPFMPLLIISAIALSPGILLWILFTWIFEKTYNWEIKI